MGPPGAPAAGRDPRTDPRLTLPDKPIAPNVPLGWAQKRVARARRFWLDGCTPRPRGGQEDSA